MYQNIIFDIGGVLVEWFPRDYLMERFMNQEIENKVFDITFGSKIWNQLDAGLLSRYEGNSAMLEAARKAGCEFEVQEVIDDWFSMLHPRGKILDLVRRLKKNGYHIYYLSNIAQDTLSQLKRNGLLNDFDGGLASYEINKTKPDLDIYNALLRRYHLYAGECVFVDDCEANTKAAYLQGITAIHMRSTSGLIRSFHQIGINTQRPHPKQHSEK